MESDKIIVVDIEATCWAHEPPPGQQNEIIEVGVCLYDLEKRERSNKQSLLVKPTRSKVSPYCTNLTTLTQEMVNDGMSFAEACRILREDYNGQNRPWLSWGNYDRNMFQEQCDSFYVEYPFSDTHYNLKRCMMRAERIRKIGLVRAMGYLKISQEGTHHRGDDDAWNIAATLHALLDRHEPQKLLQTSKR